jgi:hypothetical protein
LWRRSWDFCCGLGIVAIGTSARSFQEWKQKHRHDKMNNNIQAYATTKTDPIVNYTYSLKRKKRRRRRKREEGGEGE